MDTPAPRHPTRHILRSFGLGELDAISAGAVIRHLEDCPDCRRWVEELSPDTFLRAIRDVHAAAGNPAAGRSDSGSTRSYHEKAKAPAPPPVSTLPPGLVNHPDYEIREELGRGGMGVVYLAHNRLMGRDEVLKVIGRHITERPGILDRFQREIRSIAKLQHANIVTAYTAFRLDGGLAFAMEYVQGLDLSKLVKINGPLPVLHACYFAHQAALGLQHAHERGTVHRDIKPQNLMLTHDGKLRVVKILDFGLAKATREEKLDSGLTGEGQALGTPDYIAPEQILRPSAADIRADIYSLGCTLYYLLTGHPPFQADTLYDVYQAHMSQNADPLNLVRPEVPTELAAIAAKMMAKEPTRRFQTPVDVAQALTPFFKKGAVPFNSAGAEVSRVPPTTVDGAGPGATSATTLLGTDGAGPDLRTPGKTTPASPEARGESPKEFQEKVSSPDVAAPVARVRRPRSTWMWPVAAAGVIALVLCTAWLAGILRLNTPQGMLVVENIPESTELFVDGGKVALQIPGAARLEITVPAGKHGVEVRRGAVTLYGEQVTVAEGGRTPVAVRFERGPAEVNAPSAGHPVRTHAAGDAPAAPEPSATAATPSVVGAPHRTDAQADKPPAAPEARPTMASSKVRTTPDTAGDQPSSLPDEIDPIQPPRVVESKSVVRLRGTVGDVAVGAGGRYLFLILDRLKKIAVFDVNAVAVVKTLNIASDGVLVTAGAKKLVVVYPDQGIVQRWSLDNFQKELVQKFPFRCVIKAIAMGSNSDGPLLVYWALGTSQADPAAMSLLDISSLKPLKDLRQGGPQRNANPRLAGTGAITLFGHLGLSSSALHLRAAASGEVFGMWSASVSPQGLGSLALRGKTAEAYYEHTSVGHVVPGADGRVLYTPTAGCTTKSLRRSSAACPKMSRPSPRPTPFFALAFLVCCLLSSGREPSRR
jgi:serine/threonine protein kinase